MSRGLFKSTAVVSALTFLSRVTGLMRDQIVSYAFGADAATDAFFVAFRIPNLFRRMFAEGAFSLAFVPVLSEYKVQRSEAELRALVERVAGTLGVVLFWIMAVGVFAAPVLIWLFAPGFSADTGKFELTVVLLRITFPYLLLISLTALASGILNTFGCFAAPAFTPVLLNIVMIAAALWLAPYLDKPIMALAWGVFIAGVVQLLFQLPFLRRLRLLPRPRWSWGDAGVQRILKLMLPALFGSSIAQINLLINTILASYLVSGSVSWLFYTDRLVEFPVGIFGVALGTVILPHLSQQQASAAPERFTHALDWALRWGLFIALPATIALVILAAPLLATLFQFGKFTAEDVRMTSYSLMAYALAVLPFILIKVLAPGFYARQDTRTPVKVGVVAMLANIVLNFLLVGWLAHAGLALAAALAAYINATLLFIRLRRAGVYRVGSGWPIFLLRIVLANVALGVVLWFAAGDTGWWTAAPIGERVLYLAGVVALGMAVYGAVLLAAGLRPRHLRV